MRDNLTGILYPGVGHSKERLLDAANQAVEELKKSLPGTSGKRCLFWSFEIPVNNATAENIEVASRLIAEAFPQFEKRLFKVIERPNATEATAVIIA